VDALTVIDGCEVAVRGRSMWCVKFVARRSSVYELLPVLLVLVFLPSRMTHSANFETLI
jgi:hypothetical protein